MSIAWLGVCLGIDYTFNPQLWARAVEAPSSSVPLSLHFHHLRCTGCTDEIKKALGTLPWLKDAPMSVRVSGQDTTAGNYAGWLDISVQEISQIDFIALDQALRNEGFVAAQIEFGGLRHFRLEGKARHLCSATGQEGCEPLPDVGTVRRGERLRWLDSMTTDATGSTVIFHVRYQQPNERIDVKELFAAMDDYGMLPYTLHVIAAAE
ncbi:MAG: hypothetical protein A3H97_06990 [Acidobacteria bacterium RIFCSPLOWO2_02_FULL_65_29]|nr:MAG: hypothetical protein A3H97_06990 [Acidobacteria bacterium RIFCSPLOWO2_02_FULL_65_29]